MEPATRGINKPNISTEGKLITKPIRRSQSTKETSKTLIIQNKPYTYPTHDGQILSSSTKSSLNKTQVWDCGSSLYDSFELNSLNNQLDLAVKGISRRTLSMPHFPERYVLDTPSLPKPEIPVLTSSVVKHPKNFGRVYKSFHKFVRLVFGSSKTVKNLDNTSPIPFNEVKMSSMRHNSSSLYVYERSKSMCGLTTIPEMQEIDDGRNRRFSTDATSVVQGAVSGRFAAAYVPVSCPLRS